MYKIFCLADTDQQAYAIVGALVLQDAQAEVRGTADGAAHYLMECGVTDSAALQVEDAVRHGQALVEITLNDQAKVSAAKQVLKDMGAISISPSGDEPKQESAGQQSEYAYLDYKSTWDAIDSEPHDAYADGTRFLFDSGTFDVGDDYPRGV